MKGMQMLQQTIERVRAKLNPQLRIAGILATIYKPRTLHSQEVLELVRERYEDQVYDVTVDSSIRFAETPLAGQSILQYAPQSPGARAYRELAQRVMGGINGRSSPDKGPAAREPGTKRATGGGAARRRSAKPKS